MPTKGQRIAPSCSAITDVTQPNRIPLFTQLRLWVRNSALNDGILLMVQKGGVAATLLNAALKLQKCWYLNKDSCKETILS